MNPRKWIRKQTILNLLKKSRLSEEDTFFSPYVGSSLLSV